MRRTRSGLIVKQDNRIALIQRVRGERTYYVFPGGGVEADESVADAAVREGLEELGLIVAVKRLAAIIEYNGNEQFYHLAAITGGKLGTGTGPEFSGEGRYSDRGSYKAVWMPLDQFPRHDIRPRVLAAEVADGRIFREETPMRLYDPGV